MGFKLTKHAKEMLNERNISEAWIWKALSEVEVKKQGEDKNVHYFKSIPEYGERVLHVVVNPKTSVVITVFFDRKAKREKEK